MFSSAVSNLKIMASTIRKSVEEGFLLHTLSVLVWLRVFDEKKPVDLRYFSNIVA